MRLSLFVVFGVVCFIFGAMAGIGAMRPSHRGPTAEIIYTGPNPFYQVPTPVEVDVPGKMRRVGDSNAGESIPTPKKEVTP